MTLHFLNDVFRLNLTLEPTEGVLQRLTLLQSNFCQTDHPPNESSSDKSEHTSLRLAIIIFIVIIVIVTVAFFSFFFFLFVFFLGWLFSNEDISSYRPIGRPESGHSGCILLTSNWYASELLATERQRYNPQ